MRGPDLTGGSVGMLRLKDTDGAGAECRRSGRAKGQRRSFRPS